MRQMLLHTEAFEHRCISTQKHLPKYALTYTRVYTQKLFDTDCFSENHRSFDKEEPLHRESFTHRSFYTQAFPQKLLHREAFEHRSFYTQTTLHTEACTHGGFCPQKLLHRQAFTHKRFPTEKTIPQSSFYTLQKIAVLRKFRCSAVISCEKAASGVGKLQLTLGNHFAWKGCAWPCKIAILHKFYFARSGCAWRFKMDSRNFTPILERLHLTDVKKSQFSQPVIAVWLSCHACIGTFKITSLHQFLTVDPRFVRRGCAGSHQICILPHVWMSDLRNLCKKLPVP